MGRLDTGAAAEVAAVVLTLGRSPWLVPSLEALRRDGGAALEILLVDQGERPAELPAGLADRVLRPGRNLGFAAGTNLGIAATARRLLAVVNDDALVEPGWTARLAAALEAHPGAAAAQGVNLVLADPRLADGCGLAWNRWGQAVQTGHGEPAPRRTEPVREVFGVSATAALYRREALLAVARGGEVFDSRLVSYYEDVDLAGRLRAAGWSALLVPAARARHAGSASAAALGRERWRLLYGNRWLVAGGGSAGPAAAGAGRMLLRDLLDLARALTAGDRARAAGIPAGWLRALRHRRGFFR